MRWFFRILSALAVIFVLVQFVPYGCNQQNPAVVSEPTWDSSRTRDLFYRACADCHSNETRWLWYARVAPARWLVYRDVVEGREDLNVSEWGSGEQEPEEAAETVRNGTMPPWYYLPLHPAAKLTATEKAELISGMNNTFGTAAGAEHGEADEGEEQGEND